MRRIVIILVALMCLLSGCNKVFIDKSENTSLKDVEEAVLSTVKEKFGTSRLISISRLNQKENIGFVRVVVSTETDGIREFYYDSNSGNLSCFYNHASIEGELRQFISEQLDVSGSFNNSISISSMPSGKHVVICGDEDLSDVVRNGTYRVFGNMAFSNDAVFDKRSFDFLLELFSDVHIKIYLYDNYPSQGNLYQCEPTYEYIKTSEGIIIKGFS